MSDYKTRLERITCTLLQSDYVKMAFLSPQELTGMARLIEINLGVVSRMNESEVHDFIQGHRPKREPVI